ncbi:ATP-binding cassette domain-containing protein [Bifidobacterium simiiventris]|uniref:ATP-binding cassette domain-containing protein n=1 Tax=Bifidobacterium simiiventris TaxID=2834434 RepID=UPI001C59F1FE|nr:ATP-binding cassette domain-containing protein [Bifidobacterium simiiventris]MBW3077791.1 ATP-binding cassette domain-containing protein [Bifidobacterium simiiventris]
MTEDAEPCVVLSEVGYAYDPGRFLFRHVNAELDAGRVHALVGPSGCGKSTMLALLAGWLTPAEGKVEQRGISSFNWVPQKPIGVSRRSVIDHVVLPMMVHGLPRSTAEGHAWVILRRFGLAQIARHDYGSLSGGEAQRLMLARAVATSCDMLLVDEPTASLDRASARTVISCIRELSALGCVAVVATHDGELRSACDDVLDLGALE